MTDTTPDTTPDATPAEPWDEALRGIQAKGIPFSEALLNLFNTLEGPDDDDTDEPQPKALP